MLYVAPPPPEPAPLPAPDVPDGGMRRHVRLKGETGLWTCMDVRNYGIVCVREPITRYVRVSKIRHRKHHRRLPNVRVIRRLP